ncbi:MAG: hypothetical protein GWO20_15785 [Candidatus Korarchaeota archaeon]|nr:hypothetical protein [Candidatus Korarchaeota archaeon]NIU84932.1 hypothetical protein [Candidatus Thorarchaeota archaeon]NIW14949.1 hypothetical protein [Candidatus Thorarchaeota archaeon]NIW52916.1 hypothetical protein [Candidatus Korarchaeota archaeon]
MNSGELIDIAVLSVIIASGFNVLLLGLLIVMISWNEGEIEIPYGRIAHERDLIRMTIIICSLVFVLGVICGEGGTLPREVGLFMLVTYVAYILFLLKSKRKRMETFESHETE